MQITPRYFAGNESPVPGAVMVVAYDQSARPAMCFLSDRYWQATPDFAGLSRLLSERLAHDPGSTPHGIKIDLRDLQPGDQIPSAEAFRRS